MQTRLLASALIHCAGSAGRRCNRTEQNSKIETIPDKSSEEKTCKLVKSISTVISAGKERQEMGGREREMQITFLKISWHTN